MASGKSTVGAAVAAREGVAHRDLDTEIAGRAGRSIPELFAQEGEAVFRDLEAAELARVLDPGVVVSLGGGAPMRESSWRMIRERALSVWLDVPLEVALARAGEPDSRPLLPRAAELFEERCARYRQADHRVAADRPLDQVVDEVTRLWRE